MKIRTKLFIGFMSVLALFVIALSVAYGSLSSVHESGEKITKHYECIKMLDDLKRIIMKLNLESMNIIVDKSRGVSSERKQTLNSIEKELTQNRKSMIQTIKHQEANQEANQEAHQEENHKKDRSEKESINIETEEHVQKHQDQAKKLRAILSKIDQFISLNKNELIPLIEKKTSEASGDHVLWVYISKIDEFRKNSLELLEEIIKSEQTELGQAIQSKDTIVDIIRIMIIVTLIIGLLISTLISYFITKGIIKQLGGEPSYLAAIAKTIASKDLTLALQEDKNKQSGVYAMMKMMVDNLTQLLRQIKFVTDNAKDMSLTLGSTSEEASSTLEEMNINMDNIKDKTFLLDEEINQLNQITNEVKDFIQKVNQHITSQSSAINESSASVEEMSASIQSIAKISEAKLEIANSLEQMSLASEKEMNNTIEIIKKVADSAHVIMEMITVINGIAEQTNLLAMNAAIEAAHAGDAGKGFAVVADEIRKLAESTAKNSKEISNSLKEIINYIQTSEQSTKITGDSFAKIVHGIKEVASSMMEMKTAMQEQALGSGQILQSLGSLVKITETVRSSASEMDEKMFKITSALESVNIIASETKSGMKGLSIGANELSKTAENLLSIGMKNTENISNIESLICQFKIDNAHSKKPGLI